MKSVHPGSLAEGARTITQECAGQSFPTCEVVEKLRAYFCPCWVMGEIDDLELFYRAYMFYRRKVLEHHAYMWERLHADLEAFCDPDGRHLLPHFMMAVYYRIFIAAG